MNTQIKKIKKETTQADQNSKPKLRTDGFTLIEALVVIAITALLLVGITTMFRDIFANSRQQTAATGTIDQARMYTSTFVNEIRNLSYGADGSFPLATATSGQISFFTTYRTGGLVDKVTYTTTAGSVYKTVATPTGNPPVYGSGTQSTVMPGSTFPSLSFGYYDGTYTGFSTSSLVTPWVQRTQPAIRNWTGVAYGNGKFVAVADTATGSNEIMTSSDGITWSACVSTSCGNAAAYQWAGIAFGNGVFVAVSRTPSPTYGGTGTTTNGVMYSSDGITWNTGPSHISGVTAANPWRAITFGNGKFVAVAGCIYGNCVTNGVMTSTNGSSWTAGTNTAKAWQGVTYGNGTFVAVSADTTSSGGTAMTSTNGTSWTTQTTPGVHSWYSVAYGNSTFVAVAHDSATNDVMTSPDGITWTAQAGASTAQWEEITYGNGQFVAVADSGSASNDIMTSPDGIHWATMTSPSSTGTGYNWRAITTGGGLFVAVGGGAGSGSSSDYYIMTASTSSIASGVYTGTSLVSPINVNLVKYITISMTALKQDITGSNATFTVTEGAALRNLKTNLGN